MDAAEFQTWCDAWAGTIYGHAPHSSLGGQSPFLRAATCRTPLRRIDSPAALDILLAPIAGGDGRRRVTKLGVRVDGHHYYTSAAMPGDDVFVRHDPADLGRILLFSPAGEEFLGEGLCPDLLGLDPVETIQRVRAAQKSFEQERLKDVRAEMRKIGPRSLSDALLRAGERRAQGLTTLPKAEASYSTAAIDAAGLAAGRTVRPQAAPGPDLEARRAAMLARLPDPMPVETRADRYRRALALEARGRIGAEIDAADAEWLRIYSTTPEYIAQKLVFEDGGARTA